MIGLSQTEAKVKVALVKLMKGDLCPSYKEIAEASGYSAPSYVQKVLDQLQAKGHIRRVRGRARAIEILPERRPLSVYSTEALIAELHIRGIEA